MLGILGSTWGSIGRLRASMYRSGWLRSTRLDRPVISVGGLSVGGAGKTPTTALVATLLRDAGYRPAILSRGYRRSGSEPLLVSSGNGPEVSVERAGDEPFWLASVLSGVPVAVAALRRDAAQMVADTGEPDVFLLDDGFQHLQLQRDANLLVVNPEAPFWRDRPMPKGRLRESPTAAERADAYLVIGDADDTGTPENVLARPRFGLRRQPAFTWRAGTSFPAATATSRADTGGEPLPSGTAFAFAGIARPSRFFDDLETDGIDLRGQRGFADHHSFSTSDLRDVEKAARAVGAEFLITTEKDAVRLPQQLPEMPVWVWSYRLEADSPDALVDWLRQQAGLSSLPDAA